MNSFSELWTVRLSDWQRALIIAIISGPMGIIYDTIVAESWTFDWKAILRAAILGFFAYYGKNFVTGSNGKLLSNK